MSYKSHSFKDKGFVGEKKAADFFLEKGFEILATNYRYHRLGEIDLIVSTESLVIFVEVKFRSTKIYGGAEYAISEKKLHNISRVAEGFMCENPQFFSQKTAIRFDLIAIQNDEIRWVQDIFR